MNVAVFGAGYVGLVTGAVLAELGHRVVLVDVNEQKVEYIMAAVPPIFEQGLSELLTRVRGTDRLQATTQASQAVASSEIIFIAVGTPPLADGSPNLEYVHQAALAIGQGMVSGASYVIVNKATVPIGSANLVELWIEDGWSARYGTKPPADLFTVASNPEFLREGSAIHDTLYPDRIVLGADETWAMDRLTTLYQPIIAQSFVAPPETPRPQDRGPVPVIKTDRLSAEMIKYAANAFLSTKISFANEMANICERVGADIQTVMHGIGLDTRIGPKFLQAGVGWGGSCFGKDLSALIYTAKEYGYQPRLLESTQEVNKDQRLLVVKRLQDELKTLKGRRIALWGLSFKPGTDDLRDAPALSVIGELLRLNARVTVYDPVAMTNIQQQYPDLDIRYSESALEALDGADALVVLTEWDEFQRIPLATIAQALTQPILIDGRNLYDPKEARHLGIRYRGIGR
ncbi:MAG: UDP-glucose/GDP-mannose dehydrogenase family protein [Sulfobacillus thermosulfidooxidans]|uniref:UDP-glucose dehydrogenase family protein n=1 Tax=Sulfobacillus sp. hq2 TaxID=2039167 RepID=UPI000CD18E1B|nr:UDP-glucose/GDP-mannose dehydrogenase family protein [Sulfobacillus sp. hq2]MCY0907993.1 UDP-glucose/GDP-mannose dehydrogenase family protein [Sulfobacillus thermotolerans]POB10325.1 UDP-glucose 6-dehydrogenase [Sulfobacillus sp. hq2]PSR36785.1 MAG: UDP-glucose/GDP-mannose dehydrogenase family protein [Sulfobacillus thermosulfidooxidans]